MKYIQSKDPSASSHTLWQLCLYFLGLGTWGFGGPIALIGYMQRDLVEQKAWFTRDDFLEGLALSKLCPGPLASQLAIYLGWIQAGIWGALCVALAFVLPSFLMVVGFAIFYVRAGYLPAMEAIFYGVGAAIVAIVLYSAIHLARNANEKDPFLWLIFLVSAGLIFATQINPLWLFLSSGFFVLGIKKPEIFTKIFKGKLNNILFFPEIKAFGMSEIAEPLIRFSTMATQIITQAPFWPLLQILFYFMYVGTFVFGSGLSIVPFLQNAVVYEYHWLTEKQFLDAVAVGLITPGPMVVTVAFIGYLVAGMMGAVMAAIGIFLPCYLFVIFLAPHYRRLLKYVSIKLFVTGIISAASGAIFGAAIKLGKSSLVDLNTGLIFLGVFILVLTMRKVPSIIWLVMAGALGFILKL